MAEGHVTTPQYVQDIVVTVDLTTFLEPAIFQALLGEDG